MNLQSIGGRPFTFLCIRCNTRTASTGAAVADLESIPWRAYYCGPCAAVRRAERRRADIVQGPIVEVAQ